MNAWTLRPFEPADASAVRALWAACEGLGDGPGDSEAEITRFLARNPGLSQVAVDEGAIVGAVLCGHDGRRGFIYRLAVAPSHRRLGIARALVEHCLARLKAEGLERAMLFVLAGSADARGFWESLGGKWRERLVLYSIDLGD